MNDKQTDPAALVAALKRAPRHIQSARVRENVRRAAKLLAELHARNSDTERRETERNEKYGQLQALGKRAAESLAEMVAALECDYERLEYLRDARKALAADIGGKGQTHGQRERAEQALKEWDSENGDELKELEAAAGDCESREDAEQRIQEDPLSIELTFSPCAPGQTPEADGFIILLGTGGPAVRIIGDLDANNEPGNARIETQDWFQPWTEYFGDGIGQDALLAYCRCFYFGEG